MWGPLHGVPFTLEDAHATAGLRSTWGGYPPLLHYSPSRDAAAAARLKAAGAILIGKTNGPVIWKRSPFGLSRNPWDVNRSPGGTASGPAVALAAGMTPLDVALDTTGSLLSPAHFCGVCGMRPTEGRASLDGVFFKDRVRKFRAMSVVGPMARSVEDLRLALEIIAGPDPRDPPVPPVPWRPSPPLPLEQLKIAWTPDFALSQTTGDVRLAIRSVAAELARRGAQVEERLPAFDLTEQARLAERLYTLMDRAFERGGETPPASLEDYLRALGERDRAMARWDEFLTGCDAFLCPAGLTTAPLMAEVETGQTASNDAIAAAIPLLISPISGCPAVVLPVGLDRDGLPIGAQIIGRRWGDEGLLAVAAVVEDIGGGFRPPPGFAE